MQVDISYRNIWKIAYPIILSSLAQNIINITDTIFLGHVNETVFGAAAIASIFYAVIILIGLGFGNGAKILIGRRNGEKNYAGIGELFEQTIYFLLFLSAVLFIFLQLGTPFILKFIIKSDGIREACSSYLQYRSWGIPFVMMAMGFRSFYIGIASAKALAWSTGIMAVLNAFLNYAFIFGHWGIPALGMKGSAIGSAIAEAIGMIFLMIFTLKQKELKIFQLFKYRGINFPLLTKMLKLSIPIMVQHFLSIVSWLIFFLLIEKMGERSLAISNIIRSLYMLLMLPGWGYNMAASTIVSNLIGQGRSHEVMLAIRKTLTLSVLTAIGLAIILCISPGLWISAFTNNTVLIQETIPVLYVIAGALIVFSFSWAAFGAVEGTGNTYITLLLDVITLACYLASSYYVVMVVHATIAKVWMVEYVYLTILGILCLLYLFSAKWKSLKL